MRASPCLSLCLPALLAASAAHADLPTRIDVTGVDACSGRYPAIIESSDALNRVARELSRDGELQAAAHRVGYATANADSLYLKSTIDDDAIREVIQDWYCTAGDGRPFTEFGVYRSSNDVWIVLAEPTERPAVADSATVAARVLALVNEARQQPRQCGHRRVDAAPPLTLSRPLTEAAARHARDMAQHGVFTHLGSDGSRPAERVLQAGYRWRATGENIAAGQSSADAVVTAWLDSPEHCANIMGPQYKEMGVAFALAPSSVPAIYWAQEFASPR